MMALPLAGGMLSLSVIAMAMGLGNGMGSGLMTILGADAAPVDGRVRFLGIWRVLADSGNAAGPVVMSLVAALTTLAAGIVAVGSAGLLAAAALAVWLPTNSPLARPRDVARMRRRRLEATPSAHNDLTVLAGAAGEAPGSPE